MHIKSAVSPSYYMAPRSSHISVFVGIYYLEQKSEDSLELTI